MLGYCVDPRVPLLPEFDTRETLCRYQSLRLFMEPVDGVFPIHDFGAYAYVMLDKNNNLSLKRIMVRPPASADTTSPTLTANFSENEGGTYTITVDATDDVGLAKVNWVMQNPSATCDPRVFSPEYGYSWYQTGRQTLTGTSLQVSEKGTYYFCAMDTSGNASFVRVIIPKPDPYPWEK